MINTQTLKGNLVLQDYTTAFTLNQGDKGVPFKIELIDNGTPYTLLSTDTVSIEWYKPNGSPFLQDSNIKYGTNYIEITTPEAIAQYSGSGTFNIIISNGTVRKGTIRREYKVVPTSMKPGSVSEDVLTDATTELRNLNSTLTATIQTGNLDNYAKKTYVDKEIDLINTSLEEKANKNEVYNRQEIDIKEFHMENLGNDVKEAMTGGSVAVTGINSQGQENIKSGAIEYFKHYKEYPLLLKQKPKNLFNKNTTTDGYYVERLTGLLKENANYYTSDFICIRPNTSYSKNDKEQLAFYTATKKYISGLSGETEHFTSPDNAYFVRICNLLTKKDTSQLEEGNSITDYEAYVTDLKFDASEYFYNDVLIKNANTGDFTKEIIINTITKTIEIPSDIVLFTNNYWYNPPAQTLNITSVEFGNFIFYNKTNNNFQVIYGRSEVPTNSSGLVLLGILHNGKIYNSNSTSRFIVNGISNGGWDYERYKEKYTLNKCYKDWLGGLKSPICFLGDSTIDGDTTTGNTKNEDDIGTDIQDANTFTTKLQELLRTETSNSVLRIYNAGFSGKQADWALENINTIMQPFSDSKIIAIGYGINDRLTDLNEYYNRFYTRIEKLIRWCFENNYQPLLLTTQATCEIGIDTSVENSRSNETVNSIANSVKKELAKKYDLEIIDVNKFTDMFLQYSSYSIKEITPDGIHFSDVGHAYEAGLFFKEIVPRVIINHGETMVISLVNQKSKTDVIGFNKLVSAKGEFKIKAYYEGNTSNIMLQDVWIFNESKGKIQIQAQGDGKLDVDGSIVNITGESELIDLELGLHHIVATTDSNLVNWRGIKIV